MIDNVDINKIQKELILQAYSMLKKGGELIYSTCSFSYEEDEEAIPFAVRVVVYDNFHVSNNCIGSKY